MLALHQNRDEALHALAASMGLLLVPAVYDLQFTSGVRVDTQRLTPDSGDGPFVCTRIDEAAAMHATASWTLGVQAGARNITEGPVPFSDANAFGALVGSTSALAMRTLAFPIVLGRGETLALTVDALVGNTIAANNALSLQGYHVRSAETRERVSREADRFAATLRARLGELYVVGMQAPATGGQVQFPCSRKAVWRFLATVLGGTPTGIQLRIAGLEVFPRRLSRAAGLVATNRWNIGQLTTEPGALLEWRVDGGTSNTAVLMGASFTT